MTKNLNKCKLRSLVNCSELITPECRELTPCVPGTLEVPWHEERSAENSAVDAADADVAPGAGLADAADARVRDAQLVRAGASFGARCLDAALFWIKMLVGIMWHPHYAELSQFMSLWFMSLEALIRTPGNGFRTINLTSVRQRNRPP